MYLLGLLGYFSIDCMLHFTQWVGKVVLCEWMNLLEIKLSSALAKAGMTLGSIMKYSNAVKVFSLLLV